MKKSILAVCIVTAVIIVAALAASLCLNIAALGRVDSLKDEVSSLEEKISSLGGEDVNGEDVAAEDDVTIAEQYVIKSTKNISDAYISGSRDGLTDKELETLDMAKEVLDEIIEDGMSDYEKELAVYEWMTHNLQNDGGILPVIPTTKADCDNPYGVLKYHNAVCVGYATTFRLFMQMMGIDCKVVHNSERFHSWDLVNIGDGWYHTDIYSDAGTGGYNHFNLTDTMMMANQNWNTEYFPAADSYEYCYSYINAVKCDDVYEFPSLVRACLDSRETFLSLRFDEVSEATLQILMTMMSDIESRANFSLEFENVFFNYAPTLIDDGMLFTVNIEYPEGGVDYPDYDLSEEDYAHISEAVESSFGDLTENGNYYGDDYKDNGVWIEQ